MHAWTGYLKVNARPQIRSRTAGKTSTYVVCRYRAKSKNNRGKHNCKQHQYKITASPRQLPRPSDAQLTFTDKANIAQTETQRWKTHRKKTTHSTSARQIIVGNGQPNFASTANNRFQTDRVKWPTETQLTEATHRTHHAVHTNRTLTGQERKGLDSRGHIFFRLCARIDNLTHTSHLKKYN